jgi:hypothetical protein
MKKFVAVVASVATIGTTVSLPVDARADNGFAGFLGGLALGTFVGVATAPRYYGPGYYYESAPAYAVPAPVYVAPSCYWTRGELVWDGYRWSRQRVQVCD